MGLILGIDIGGSTTKIVGLNSEKKVVNAMRVRADDQVTSLYGAFGNFVSSNGISYEDIDKVAITGVGASFIEGDVYNIPTDRVDEFVAIGQGGLRLSGIDRAVVVSMGTGTAYIYADENGCRHLGGSGMGGGTIVGLCKQFLNLGSFEAIKNISRQGDLSKIDLRVADISNKKIDTLPADLTASNFAGIKNDAVRADFALGFVNMVFETIGSMAVFACKSCSCNKAVLIGSLSMLDQAETIFSTFENMFGIDFIIPENAPFATAIGAALSIM